MVANIYLGKRTTSEIHDDNENQNGIKLPLNSPKKLKLCTGKYCEEIKLHRLDYIIIYIKVYIRSNYHLHRTPPP